MIDGVIVKELTVHQDIPDRVEDAQRGLLMEVLRADDKLLKKFGQSTMSVAHQGTVKAYHWHKNQDDVWFIATGKAKVVLHDRRPESPTRGQTQEIIVGEDNYKTILIPKGVIHGYKVLSKEPVILFYHTTEVYNSRNPDEERVAWDYLGAEIWNSD